MEHTQEPYLFKVGDRVTRKKVNAFRYSPDIIGTIVEIKEGKRYRIQWDEKASTGQQHSTISERFLMKVTTE